MKNKDLKWLLFVSKSYSFSILKPIQKTIFNLNYGEVKWFVIGSALYYPCPGTQLKTNQEVVSYNPDVVIVPGNIVPDFWSGLKVQIFHGLDDEVKGFYKITGLFDLYCTTGPVMTENFLRLANKKKHFLVRETGWSKIDEVYNSNWNFKEQKNHLISKYKLCYGLPVILYAPTFPKKYTSAMDLVDSINELKECDYNWIIKFHPLMDKSVKERYKSICGHNFQIADELNILPIMTGSDILITDISSVAYEFLHFNRPLITYKAIARIDKGINIQDPSELYPAIERSLNDPDEFLPNRERNLYDVHPYRDGKSSKRIIEEIKDILDNELHTKLKRKPRNIIRKYQIRKMLS